MSQSLSPLLLETLEGRIVPATLVHGANVLGGTVDGIQMDREGFYSQGGQSVLLAEVHRGQIIVWYDGFAEAIVGVSVGQNASFSIFGHVFGDIVTNLAGNGRLSDSDGDPTNGYDGRVLLPWDLRDINISGSVGRMISGGSAFNISLAHFTGAFQVDELEREWLLGGIYTGNGIFKADPEGTGEATYTVSFGDMIDANPVRPGFQNTILLEAGLAQYGRSFDIYDINIVWSNGTELWAGDGLDVIGGRGGVGGSIYNVTGGYATPPKPRRLYCRGGRRRGGEFRRHGRANRGYFANRGSPLPLFPVGQRRQWRQYGRGCRKDHRAEHFRDACRPLPGYRRRRWWFRIRPWRSRGGNFRSND